MVDPYIQLSESWISLSIICRSTSYGSPVHTLQSTKCGQ